MTRTYSRRTTLKLGAGAAAGAAILGFPSVARAARDRIVVRQDRDIQVLDPAFRIGAAEGNIISACCQRLASFRPGSLDYVPDAAESIKQVSDTLIEFTLKPGQTFTDGYGELTAEDVKFSFERFGVVQKDGKKSSYASDWGALKEVEITGKYSGKIHLKNPAPAIWRTAICDTSGNLLSAKAGAALGDKITSQLVGSGPYRIAKWEPNRQLVLAINPDYKGAKPHFKEVVIRPIQESKTAEIALRAKEIDFTRLEDPVAADTISKEAGLKVIEMPGMRYLWIGLNVEKAPLDNLKVRQGMRLGVDVDAALAAAYGGKVKRANAMLQPSLVGYWKDAPVRKRDVAAAKKLLAEAGLASGFKTRLTVLNQAAYKTMAQVVQAHLAEIGVTVEIEALDGGSYWNSGKGDIGKNLDMSMQLFSAKMDPSFTSQWFVSEQVGVWNWQRWANPEYDSLHKLAASTVDEAERAKAMVRAQQLMDELAAFIWLTYDSNVFGAAAWAKPAILPNGTDWQFWNFAEA